MVSHRRFGPLSVAEATLPALTLERQHAEQVTLVSTQQLPTSKSKRMNTSVVRLVVQRVDLLLHLRNIPLTGIHLFLVVLVLRFLLGAVHLDVLIRSLLDGLLLARTIGASRRSIGLDDLSELTRNDESFEE